MGFSFKAMNMLGKVLGFKRLNSYDFKNSTFDKYSSRLVETCDLFHTWDRTTECLKQAKERNSTTILEVEMDIWKGECLQYVDYFFVPSKFLYQKAKDLGIAEDRIFYLPFGVDAETFKPSGSPKTNETTKRFLFSGALNDRKGIGDLLSAWKKAKLPNAVLSLCGRSTPFFRKQIQKHGTENVEILGFLSREQLLKEYQRSYAFVFPSKKEGSAKVIYEALACGLPVITTEESGSIITDQKEGFIIPKSNPIELSDKITLLANSIQLHETMSIAARDIALQNTWNHYVERTMANYSKIVSHKQS